MKLFSFKDITYIAFIDTSNFLNLFHVGKQEQIFKNKIHQEEIVNMKLINGHVYSLDRSGIIKVFEIETKQVINLINLNSKNSNKNSIFSQLDIDSQEKNIIFTKNLKIKSVNLKTLKVETIGMHSSFISNINFSTDGKYVISITNKDYYLYIWSKNSKKNEDSNTIIPYVTLPKTSLTSNAVMIHMENGLYHIFTHNEKLVLGYLLDTNHVDLSNPIVKLNFSEDDLISIKILKDSEKSKGAQTIFYIHGKTFNSTYIKSGKIKYSKNIKELKQLDITIEPITKNNKSTKNNVIVPSTFKILNEIEMADNSLIVDFEKDVTSVTSLKTVELEKIEDGKFSLLNILKNSIINSDFNTFSWALEQKDNKLIDATVKKMESDIIQGFCYNMINVLQSNNLYKKNLLPWFNSLLTNHKAEFLKFPSKYSQILQSINTIINSRTKNFDRIISLKEKLNNLKKVYKRNDHIKQDNLQPQPMLIYNESDSEEEAKNEFNKRIEINGIKKVKVSELIKSDSENEEEEIESDEDLQELADDFLDEEINEEVEEMSLDESEN